MTNKKSSIFSIKNARKRQKTAWKTVYSQFFSLALLGFLKGTPKRIKKQGEDRAMRNWELGSKHWEIGQLKLRNWEMKIHWYWEIAFRKSEKMRNSTAKTENWEYASLMKNKKLTEKFRRYAPLLNFFGNLWQFFSTDNVQFYKRTGIYYSQS